MISVMARLPLEIASLTALAAFTALTLSAPGNADTARPAAPAANIAVAPAITEQSSAPAQPGRIIRRHVDGLFYVTAEANGQLIRFVVDTGATVVVLNREDAEKLGLPYDSLASRGSMRTVGGASDMRWAKIDRLDMAGKRIEKINAAVVDKGLPVSLMGQNALEQLGTVTLRGDTMTIH
jgi:aspartyl protease family protein